MNTENEVKDYINALLLNLKTQGIESVSASKILLFINEKMRLSLDQDALEELLDDNIVSEINGEQIILSGKKKAEEDEANDTVQDMAKDAAYDNLTSESVDYELKKPLLGKSFTLKQEIDENMDNYHLLKSIKKNNGKLIITDVLRENKEIILKCKIDGTSMFVDINKKMI